MKTRIFIIIILSVILQKALSQEFNKVELDKISNKTDSLISLYEDYSCFTEDNENISNQYIENFKNLFENKNLYVYNDIDIEHESLDEDKLILQDYIYWVKRLYSEGLGVEIKEIAKENPQKINYNKYIIKINLKKRIFGFYKNKKIEENIIPLIFTVGFHKNGNVFQNFKIISINNFEEERISNNKNKKWEVGGYASTYTSSITNKIIETNNGMGYNGNVNITYYYKNIDELGYSRIGGGFGLGISTIKSSLKLNSYKNPDYIFKDIDEDTCTILTTLDSLKDEVNIHFIDFNINLLKYENTKLLNNWNVFASLSFNISYIQYSKFNISGNTTDKAYYAAPYYVTLYDIDYLGYKTNDPFKDNGAIEINKINYSTSLELGLSKLLFRNFNFNISLYYRYGSINFSNNKNNGSITSRIEEETKNTYHSLLQTEKKSKYQIFGIQTGISIKF